MVDDGLGDFEKRIHNWVGKHLHTGPVLTSERVERLEAVLRLRQGPPAAGGGGGTGAAGSPAADGGSGTASGGGAPKTRNIEFTRKISALEVKIGQLEERNADLKESLQTLDSKFSSLVAHFKHFALSLPSS